jgi:hypothetical protein
MQKYRQVRDEFAEFKVKASQYQQAVYELAKSATKSSRRVGMLTQTVLALRKHFAAEPHLEDCDFISYKDGDSGETGDSPLGPCSCGHDAILESVDKALAEPDFDPEVHVEIKDPQNPMEAPHVEAGNEMPAAISTVAVL